MKSKTPPARLVGLADREVHGPVHLPENAESPLKAHTDPADRGARALRHMGRVKKVPSGPGEKSTASESATQRLAPLVTESLDSLVSCNKRPKQAGKDSMFFQSCQLTSPKNFQSACYGGRSWAKIPEDGTPKGQTFQGQSEAFRVPNRRRDVSFRSRRVLV